MHDPREVAVYLGLDVGKSGHHAVGLSPAGKKVHDRALPNSEPKLRALFDKLAAKHGQVLVVVDQPASIGDRYSGRVRYVKLPAPVLRVVGVGLRAWWKIRKPATYGVKVLLIHPDDPARCLIVRHSYSDSARWGLPGGAYKPDRETAEHAGVREVSEELCLTIVDVPKTLDTVTTTLEGKRDTLTIVSATPTSAAFVLAPELAEARWVGADISAMPEGEPVSRWLQLALSVHGNA